MDFKKSSLGNTETSKYYGIGTFKPGMVNPTKEELGLFLGRNIEKDIVYVSTKTEDGKAVKVLRLDVWGEVPATEDRPLLKTKVTFFLEGKFDVSAKQKTKYINGQGLSVYADESGSLDYVNAKTYWFYTKNARKAIVGEDLVMDFFVKLWNVENRIEKFTLVDDDMPDFFLDTEKLFKNDFSSIQNNINRYPECAIKCFFGIRSRSVDEKTYYDMEIYNKRFQYNNAKSNKPIIDALNNEYSAFKNNIAPISETLMPFDMSIIKKVQEEAALAKVEDDLPF